MADLTGFSAKLLAHPEAKNEAALDRIRLGKRRIQNILDSNPIAIGRTLEQKISDQGPRDMRVDPHLLGLSLMDLEETKRVKRTNFAGIPWFSNISKSDAEIQERLVTLAPIYTGTHQNGFGNLIGDALEIIVFKILKAQHEEFPKFSFLGDFDLNSPPNNQGRFSSAKPPKAINGGRTVKEADFVLFGHEAGAICMECKNFREWLYPGSNFIKNLIIKSDDLNCLPMMIHRRIHYSTISNLFKPAGIIAHETYHQYYPSSASELAILAKDVKNLGFSDIIFDENPHPRTIKFITQTLSTIIDDAALRWKKNRNVLRDYAENRISIERLYKEINSRAAY